LRVLIDILTPKQCMFFSRLSENLEGRGHQVFKATRRYREVLQLLKLKGIDAVVVGRHGGKALIEKLRASVQRTERLTSLFMEVKPDVSVSFSSPEMARVAFGLGTPHLCINDSPHAEAVARLTIPLSERLLTPKVIPKKAWVKYGISPEKIIQYNALDPWVWLKDFKPDRKILEKLRLDESKPILTFRPEESFAAYLLGKTSEKGISITPVIERLLEKRTDLQIVAIPRYKEQIAALKETFKGRIVTCKSVIDGPSLLSHTDIFIGAGGTMSAEAAILGVPTFSIYPDKPFLIEDYLIKKGLIIYETNPERLTEKITETLDNIDLIKKMQCEKAQRMVERFENPIEVLVREIERFK